MSTRFVQPSERQYPLVAEAILRNEDVAADIAAGGTGLITAVKLPAGACILDIVAYVREVFAGGTTVDIGDAASATQFISNGSISGTGQLSLTKTSFGKKYSVTDGVTVQFDAPSAIHDDSVHEGDVGGILSVRVVYTLDGRGNETQTA